MPGDSPAAQVNCPPRSTGLWFDKIVPLARGQGLGRFARAYSYLPQSVKEFVEPDKLS